MLFQGRLISNDDRDSSTLASDLEKWVSSNPKVVIQGELVQVVSRDAPSRDAPRSTEQEGGASTVMMVGTIVGVAIVLILVAVTTVSVVACYRHKR